MAIVQNHACEEPRNRHARHVAAAPPQKPSIDPSGWFKPNHDISPQSLLRLKQVLTIVPVAASTWWKHVSDGTFPAPLKLGPRVTVWRAADILALIKGEDSNA